MHGCCLRPPVDTGDKARTEILLLVCSSRIWQQKQAGICNADYAEGGSQKALPSLSLMHDVAATFRLRMLRCRLPQTLDSNHQLASAALSVKTQSGITEAIQHLGRGMPASAGILAGISEYRAIAQCKCKRLLDSSVGYCRGSDRAFVPPFVQDITESKCV